MHPPFASAGRINAGGFLARKVVAQIGATTIPITPFRLRSGLAMERIFAAYASLHLGDECAGFGYTMHLDEASAVAASQAMARMLEQQATTPAQLLAIEELVYSGPTVELAERSAANALSLAAWDLTGRHLDQPCAQLWGSKERVLHCYDSYTLAFAEDQDLVRAAEACVERGVRQAKMIVGQHSLEQDLARVEAVLEVLGPHNLAVDALCSWQAQQANEFMSRVSEPLLWVEDPVPYDQLGQLEARQPIATGERSSGLAELLWLAQQGSTGLLIDPGLLGGPVRQLQVSKVLAGLGISVGFHAYPYYLAHIAACLSNSLPVEMQNWGDPLFSTRPELNAAGELELTGPGFGLIPDMAEIGRRSCAMQYIN